MGCVFTMAAKKAGKKAGKKKAVKKKAPKISARTAMRRVWAGKLNKTKGGLTKADLCKNKRGKIVSKKQHSAAKRLSKYASKWMAALKRARKELKLKGFALQEGHRL